MSADINDFDRVYGPDATRQKLDQAAVRSQSDDLDRLIRILMNICNFRSIELHWRSAEKLRSMIVSRGYDPDRDFDQNGDPVRKSNRNGNGSAVVVVDVVQPSEQVHAPASTLQKVIKAFDKWLHLGGDHTPIYAVLGAAAANMLPGDPVWLGLIAPPSSAKTEILNALLKLDCVEPTATLTTAALLSGTPKSSETKRPPEGCSKRWVSSASWC
jgi:hypothetical protein